MYGEVYVGERTMRGRLQDRRNAHESRRLAHLARSQSRTSLAIQARRLLGRMSHLLVVAGARLVEHGLPPYAPVERGLTENRSQRA